MKKIYSLIALALCVTASFAQNEVIIADFEDGTSPLYSWNGSTLEVLSNPSSNTVNSSSYALKFNPNSWNEAAATWSDAGDLFKPNYISYSIDVYVPSFPAGTTKATIKLHGDNSISDPNAGDYNLGIKYEKYQDITVAGEWVTLTYDITDNEVFDFKQLAIQSDAAFDIFIDNIIFVKDPALSIGTEINFDTNNILVNKGNIVINDCNNSKVAIYALSGAKVFSQDHTGGNVSVNVAPGLYIVVVDNTSTKVVVK
ncbi:hypothetical protein [Marinilabilia sp.]|uniref:hypothetical protein n=1 Tax=Marinilabilia sp. TaxID=2021252 RepID=UPI0025C6FA02|nr:hypothetical protein [Marinilabilia sp.]